MVTGEEDDVLSFPRAVGPLEDERRGLRGARHGQQCENGILADRSNHVVSAFSFVAPARMADSPVSTTLTLVPFQSGRILVDFTRSPPPRGNWHAADAIVRARTDRR